MVGLLRAQLLFTFLVIFLFFGAGTPAAQAATNEAAALSQATAQEYFKKCKDSAGVAGVACEYVSPDKVETKCYVVVQFGWNCTFTYPDKSRLEADKNLFAGSTYTNYDSDGKEVGKKDTGAADVADGTLATAPDYGKDNSCGLDALCWLKLLPGYIVSGIAYLLLVLSSLILWVAGSVTAVSLAGEDHNTFDRHW